MPVFIFLTPKNTFNLYIYSKRRFHESKPSRMLSMYELNLKYCIPLVSFLSSSTKYSHFVTSKLAELEKNYIILVLSPAAGITWFYWPTAQKEGNGFRVYVCAYNRFDGLWWMTLASFWSRDWHKMGIIYVGISRYPVVFVFRFLILIPRYLYETKILKSRDPTRLLNRLPWPLITDATATKVLKRIGMYPNQ